MPRAAARPARPTRPSSTPVDAKVVYAGQPEPVGLGDRIADGGVDLGVGGHRQDGIDEIHGLIAEDARWPGRENPGR